MMRVFLLGSIMMLAFCDAQKPTEIKESELKNLVKPTPGADLKKSFRCGVFYIDPNEPAPEEGGRPAASLLIFNATWDAADECPGGNYPRYESFCNSIVRFLFIFTFFYFYFEETIQDTRAFAIPL